MHKDEGHQMQMTKPLWERVREMTIIERQLHSHELSLFPEFYFGKRKTEHVDEHIISDYP